MRRNWFFVFIFLLFAGVQLFQGVPGEVFSGTIDLKFLTEFRLNRLLVSCALGVILTLSGIVLQAIFSNPLAEPYTLGVASSSALGAAVAAGFFGAHSMGMVGGALFGAIFVTFILYSILKNRNTTASLALLTGVMISHVAAAMLTVWTSLSSPDQLHTVLNWLMGDCTRANFSQSLILLGMAALLFVWAFFRAGSMDAFLFGENWVESFGVNKDRFRNEAILVVSLAIGISVAFAGVVGFLGLMVPHFVRHAHGAKHRSLVVRSAAIGAFILLGSDLLSRGFGMWNSEIPVGAILAIVGVPFLLSVLWRKHVAGGIAT